MSVEENKASVHRIFEEFINGGNLEVADELFAEDFVNHSPARGTTPDLEGLKQYVTMLYTGFPDSNITVDELIAEGDKVVIRVTGRGTHTGDFSGLPPTGKQIEVPAVSILRFAEGKVVERWNIYDSLLLLQQLGIIPSMG